MDKKAVFILTFFFILIFITSDTFARDFIPLGSDGRATTTVLHKETELLYYVIGVVMIIGGFGLVGLSVAAIFGTVKWKWAAYLAFGLLICAMAFAIIGYVTGDQIGPYYSMLYDTAAGDRVTITPSD